MKMRRFKSQPGKFSVAQVQNVPPKNSVSFSGFDNRCVMYMTSFNTQRICGQKEKLSFKCSQLAR